MRSVLAAAIASAACGTGKRSGRAGTLHRLGCSVEVAQAA